MRMFIGFGLSLENKKKIEKLQKDLDVKGRFTAIDNLHLTLIFLG
ncbi:MAG TPA: RNA 2',3'-cyclic phosphodiesterase, partial [Acholeplasmataceae bacterium]|nr:RNA 2',3'-cyclic phosphodiesterase [Acholeplasmataceae bacterium]